MARKRIYGPRSREVAAAMITTIRSYIDLDQLNYAASMVDDAISILGVCGLSDSCEYANALHQHGAVLRAQGRSQKALEPLVRCLVIRRRLLPPSHRDIAYSYSRIREVLLDLGMDAKADAFSVAAGLVYRRSQTECAGPGCLLKLREDGKPLDVCVKCRRTFYCSKACQTADWTLYHKKECKALIAEGKAAAAAAAEGAPR